MKLFIGIVAGVILLIMGGVAAQPGEGDTSVPESQEHQTDNNVELVTIIDDVEIPFDVLISIQKKHIGYAATQADEVSIEGQAGYRLVATRYDEPSDQDEDRGIRLLYDSNWELINESEIIPETEDGDDDNGDDESDDTDDNESGGEDAENDEDEAEEESSDQDEADEEPNGNIGGPREETSENDEAADTEDEEETDGDTTDGETTEDGDGTTDDDETTTDEEETNSEDESGDSTSDEDDADDTNEETDDDSNTA